MRSFAFNVYPAAPALYFTRTTFARVLTEKVVMSKWEWRQYEEALYHGNYAVRTDLENVRSVASTPIESIPVCAEIGKPKQTEVQYSRNLKYCDHNCDCTSKCKMIV